ncbi:MAG TPA: hypothetical protein ENI35_01800 [Candidatus Desulfofervidus auxilii]|uniref:Uncharacterized protein n=1 Tax=Desulfofervidus auxilii TaxID=1621989 RepID=A0A7C1W306_DESA2|nr:hypothetical protein [Candidatus Desulfofervidus auxilii]
MVGKLVATELKEIQKETFYRECFHKDENCSGRTIKAHSIQKNRILKKLSSNGLVLGFDYYSHMAAGFNPFDPILKEIGVKKASTFTGFCSYHDRAIFGPIENLDYEVGNKAQEFLFAYRAFAKEYHAKMSVQRFLNKLIGKIERDGFKILYLNQSKNIPFGYSEWKKASLSFWRRALKGTKDTLKKLEREKIAFNINLDKGRYYKIESDVIVFPKEHYIAVSSIFFLERDLNGKVVNDLRYVSNYGKPIFLNIFPQNGKTYAILSYYKKHKEAFSFLETQVIKKDENIQKTIISNFIILHPLENFYVSPQKWNSIPDKKKQLFYKKWSDSLLSFNSQISTKEHFNFFHFL